MSTSFLDDMLSSRWVEGQTGQASSVEIFDAGRDGLAFFADFGPLYGKYRGISFDYDRDIGEHYDAQREIAFGKLRADASRLRTLCEAMSETSLDFRNAAAPLFGSWEGEAAEAARTHLDGMLHSAGSAWDRLGALASAIDEAADGAERVVLDKASSVRALELEKVGGLDAGQVGLLVECAAAGTELSDKQLVALAELCGLDITPVLCRTNPDLLDLVAADVRGWLDHAFVPVYEARLEAFQAACTTAESDLDSAWAGMRAALDAVGELPPTEPVGPQETTAAAGPSGLVLGVAPGPVTAEPGPGATPGPAAVPGPVDSSAGAAPRDTEHSGPEQGTRFGAGTDTMAMHDAPVAAAPAAAASGQGRGNAPFQQFFPAGGGVQGGGDRDHRRRFPLAGEVVPEAADPLAGLGEPDEFADKDPGPAPEPEPKQEEESLWELGEDGELRCLTKPND